MLIRSIDTDSAIRFENVRKIHIYNDGEILYTAERGTLEESRVTNGKISTVYDGKILGLTLATEPKRARKINLSRKDNYFLNWRGDYSWENGIALYIHASEISVDPAGEYLAFESNGERDYKNAWCLRFAHGATVHRLKMERIPDAGPDFTPPEGCKWSKIYSPDPEKPFYDVIHPRAWADEPGEPVVVKRWEARETLTEILVESSYYTRTEKEPERASRERIAEEMNKILRHHSVSHYDVEKLLSVFNITFKGE